MTRKELAKLLSKQTSLKAKNAEDLVIAFGDVISDALLQDKKIVYSNFGTFYKVHYPSKIIYHPKLGKAKKMVMLPTDAVKWMPSGNIKEMVNSGIEIENPTIHGKKKIKSAETFDSETGNQVLDQETIDIPIKITKKTKPEVVSKTEKGQTENLEIDIDDDQPINIYEEKMDDGSKFESTFSDAIRVHKPKRSFFDRVFKKSNVDENETAVSPSETKILDIDVSRSNKEIEITPFETRNSISYKNLSDITVPKELLQKLPKKVAKQYKIVPIGEENFVLLCNFFR